MTSANRNPQAQNGPQSSPRTPHVPGTRTSREFPVPALQPDPRVVRLKVDNTEPLANLVLIPKNINDRTLAKVFPDNYLYIIDNQLSEPDDEPDAARPGCKCECKYYRRKKPRSEVQERKKDENLDYIDAAKGLGTENIAPKATNVQERQDIGGLPDEDDRSDITHPSPTSRSHAEPRRYETSKKGHATSSSQKHNRSRTLDGHVGLPNHCPSPELPSLPPKTKPPPSRRDPEPFRAQGDWWKHGYHNSHNYFQSKKGVSERPLNRSWGQQRIPQKKGRRANTMTEGYASRKPPLTFTEKEELAISPRTRYADHYPCRTRWVPPRASSRGFSDVVDVYGTASRTATRSSSSSSDYRRYE